MAARTSNYLCTVRLSRTTTWPGRNDGTRICSTYARKLALSIGPSNTADAPIPSGRRPRSRSASANDCTACGRGGASREDSVRSAAIRRGSPRTRRGKRTGGRRGAATRRAIDAVAPRRQPGAVRRRVSFSLRVSSNLGIAYPRKGAVPLLGSAYTRASTSSPRSVPDDKRSAEGALESLVEILGEPGWQQWH
jgi:hypothetical protein